jgi:tryptophan 2,3-dioxygenase
MPLTYHSYLKIDQLLSLQELQSSEEHDEMLFIVIHQAYELWFKEILHELDYITRLLEQQEIHKTKHAMKRILTIMKVLVHQVDILETMTPIEFLSFRDYLKTASGFQSYQWRELEFVLGMKSDKHLKRFSVDSPIHKKLKERLQAPTLWQSFLKYLKNIGYEIPTELVQSGVSPSTVSSAVVQKTLIDIYYNNPSLSDFCELLIDLDEGLQEWRYRHVKMVERTIGFKSGTGGSPGVPYLKETLFKPLFPDLWEIRSYFNK